MLPIQTSSTFPACARSTLPIRRKRQLRSCANTGRFCNRSPRVHLGSCALAIKRQTQRSRTVGGQALYDELADIRNAFYGYAWNYYATNGGPPLLDILSGRPQRAWWTPLQAWNAAREKKPIFLLECGWSSRLAPNTFPQQQSLFRYLPFATLDAFRGMQVIIIYLLEYRNDPVNDPYFGLTMNGELTELGEGTKALQMARRTQNGS